MRDLGACNLSLWIRHCQILSVSENDSAVFSSIRILAARRIDPQDPAVVMLRVFACKRYLRYPGAMVWILLLVPVTDTSALGYPPLLTILTRSDRNLRGMWCWCACLHALQTHIPLDYDLRHVAHLASRERQVHLAVCPEHSHGGHEPFERSRGAEV
ncbi:hypothetical protein PYCCODRAFT_799589 [Trametes coccinea BRFM310]|uniref:Uncharacterized protein n=1 Tax=Trametes coccinea (strain BRFM310) TaxID=1353009 RepID=A0A1Y2IEU8_TRAC3|nr:hypothetical protein PYCCODRAFT_799589 [Trametes coccinea BRFM310]